MADVGSWALDPEPWTLSNEYRIVMPALQPPFFLLAIAGSFQRFGKNQHAFHILRKAYVLSGTQSPGLHKQFFPERMGFITGQ